MPYVRSCGSMLEVVFSFASFFSNQGVKDGQRRIRQEIKGGSVSSLQRAISACLEGNGGQC